MSEGVWLRLQLMDRERLQDLSLGLLVCFLLVLLFDLPVDYMLYVLTL
jgi:hypothetical protein